MKQVKLQDRQYTVLLSDKEILLLRDALDYYTGHEKTYPNTTGDDACVPDHMTDYCADELVDEFEIIQHNSGAVPFDK